MRQILKDAGHHLDLQHQIGDMVAEAVDRALKLLNASGGQRPERPSGYQFPARTPEEIRDTPAAKEV